MVSRRLAVGFGLLLLALCGIAGYAQSQRPAAKEAKEPIEIKLVTQDVQNPRVGDEFTITASIHNARTHVVLTNLRLLTTDAVVAVVPEAEQIIFVEGGVDRDVKWRAKVVKAGRVAFDVSSEVISEGRPLSGSLTGIAPGANPAGGPRTDIPVAAKLALTKLWAGTWTSPEGFVYDADVQAKLDPTGAVEARITWALNKSPASRPEYNDKIGLKGIEFAWGTYDPQTRTLYLEGYRRDDPHQILGLEKYRLTLSDNYKTITGITWNHGTWDAVLSLVSK